MAIQTDTFPLSICRVPQSDSLFGVVWKTNCLKLVCLLSREEETLSPPEATAVSCRVKEYNGISVDRQTEALVPSFSGLGKKVKNALLNILPLVDKIKLKWPLSLKKFIALHFFKQSLYVYLCYVGRYILYFETTKTASVVLWL